MAYCYVVNVAQKIFNIFNSGIRKATFPAGINPECNSSQVGLTTEHSYFISAEELSHVFCSRVLAKNLGSKKAVEVHRKRGKTSVTQVGILCSNSQFQYLLSSGDR